MDLRLILKSKINIPFFDWILKIGFRFLSHILSVKKQVFYAYSLFFLSSLLLTLLFNKHNLHLSINKYNNIVFDVLFKYSTFLGDGALFGVLVVIFFFIKKRMSIVFLFSGVLTLLITHLLKKIIFKGIPRPVKALGEETLHLVEGVKMALWNSFPSGHTTTAFAIATILCLYFSKCKSQYLWFSLAVIAGFSRVYLSQHYLVDIFVGSFIGVVIGFLSMSFFFRPKRLQ